MVYQDELEGTVHVSAVFVDAAIPEDLAYCICSSLSLSGIRLFNIGESGRVQELCMEIFLTCLQQAHH